MKICIVDERISEKCERSLLRLGFHIIKLPPAENAPAATASHTDIIMFYHKGRIIASAEYCERYPYIFSDIRELSPNCEFTFTDDVQGDKYPEDAVFNALTAEDSIFIKTDTASQAVIDYALTQGLKVVSTRQGYPACTVLSLGRYAITADHGMAQLLSSHGINITLIENGGISLPPYEYGFIGGTAGIYGDTVYFLGDVTTHPDADKIQTAVKDAGFNVCSLSDEPLSDLGGIVFVDQTL